MRFCISVAIAALVARTFAFILLPNPEQDAYSYVEQIAAWAEKMSTGEFRLRDLFGFWLPLYQLAAAGLACIVGDALFAGRLLSAVMGTATCVLIYLVAVELGARPIFGALVALLAALTPLHLVYSTASMTDAPYAFLITAGTLATVRARWILAATLMAAAALMRLEAWALMPLVPAAQYLQERRISLTTAALAVLTPWAWLFIAWHSTGSWFAYFTERSSYLQMYFEHVPSRETLQMHDVWRDVVYLTFGANLVVLLAAFTVAIKQLACALRNVGDVRVPPAFACATFATLCCFLAAAYLSRNQPVLWPRYGLPLFITGLPLFALGLQRLWDRKSLRYIAVIALLFACSESLRQGLIIPPLIQNHRARSAVAHELALRAEKTHARVFSDDAAVRVLSGLPFTTFRRTAHTPEVAQTSAEAFLRHLRQERVGFVVISDFENSLSSKLLRKNHLHLLRREATRFEPEVALYELPPP